MSLLSVRDLTKRFSSFSLFRPKPDFVAVDRVSFDLHQSEVLGILGANGAGKTTTFSMLLGVLTPTSGSIEYFGKSLYTHHREIMSMVSSASAYSRLPSSLTVWDNLDIAARLYNIPSNKRTKRIQEMLEMFGIQEIRNKFVGPLSAGQMTRLMLARAFLPRPRIVLLDEPTASLDPDIAQEVRDFILAQKRDYGVSFIFTSHNMDEVSQVCDRVLVFKAGRIIANSTPHELAATITTAHIEIYIPDRSHRDRTYVYLNQMKFPYSTRGCTVYVTLDEQMIAKLLMGLAHSDVTYTQIAINKPTLHDYFVKIAV